MLIQFKIGDEVEHKGIKMLVHLVEDKGKFPIGCKFWDRAIYDRDRKNRMMWFAPRELEMWED